MITGRGLLLFGFLALLSGCANPCVLPDRISDHPAPECLYKLKVNHVDNYLVNGQVADDLIKKGKKVETFNFQVQDLQNLQNVIKEKETYYFLRKGNNPYLYLFIQKPIGVYEGEDAGADPEKFGK